MSQVTKVLWADYEAFAERNLSGFEVEYLFLDAVYESLREQAGLKEGVLVAWAICNDGRKVLLHTRNALDKVPDSARDEVKAMIQASYYAPNQDAARMIAAEVLETYQDRYPATMRSFQDDWEACTAYLRCPAVHHKRIRTTNLLERSFLEERRRTKVIPRFFTEKSCIKLVFATLSRASQRWQGVKMSEFERQQLKLLRHELSLLPEETQGIVERRAQRLVA